MNKNQTHIRIMPDVKIKLNEIKYGVAAIEKRRISDAELIRRITNIPNLKPVLLKDAELKRFKNEK